MVDLHKEEVETLEDLRDIVMSGIWGGAAMITSTIFLVISSIIIIGIEAGIEASGPLLFLEAIAVSLCIVSAFLFWMGTAIMFDGKSRASFQRAAKIFRRLGVVE